MMRKWNDHQVLAVATAALTLLGLLMVYSISSAGMHPGRDALREFQRQAVLAAGGYALMIGLMFVDYRVWQRRGVLAALVLFTVVCLLLVFAQPEIKGARRWLRFGSLSFQPSETAKLVVILLLASFLGRRANGAQRLGTDTASILGVVGLFVGLIAAEPDLGQAVCLACIAGVVLFVAGLGWRYVGATVALCVPAFYFLVWKVKFRRLRIEAFLDDTRGAVEAGWHVLQAKIAVGSGGLFGAGFGNGLQKPPFLPEADTDYVFAVVAEELGFAGSGPVILLFLMVFFCGIRIALKARDRTGFYLALGISIMVVLQALLSVLMVLALLPPKGIALPFVSRGGTSLLVNMAAVGMLLNVSLQRDSRIGAGAARGFREAASCLHPER